ncbi:unnamed protein product [Amoebophrya sp. A25]|nr:unnamed protein product [Amoebophrya sp. A25]|eukprot:GSA25T00026201001.1
MLEFFPDQANVLGNARNVLGSSNKQQNHSLLQSTTFPSRAVVYAPPSVVRLVPTSCTSRTKPQKPAVGVVLKKDAREGRRTRSKDLERNPRKLSKTSSDTEGDLASFLAAYALPIGINTEDSTTSTGTTSKRQNDDNTAVVEVVAKDTESRKNHDEEASCDRSGHDAHAQHVIINNIFKQGANIEESYTQEVPAPPHTPVEGDLEMS